VKLTDTGKNNKSLRPLKVLKDLKTIPYMFCLKITSENSGVGWGWGCGVNGRRRVCDACAVFGFRTWWSHYTSLSFRFSVALIITCHRPSRKSSLRIIGLWQGVAMDSLKIHPGLLCPTLPCPVGGPPLKRPWIPHAVRLWLWSRLLPRGHHLCSKTCYVLLSIRYI
jgi:hypothetical protein